MAINIMFVATGFRAKSMTFTGGGARSVSSETAGAVPVVLLPVCLMSCADGDANNVVATLSEQYSRSDAVAKVSCRTE